MVHLELGVLLAQAFELCELGLAQSMWISCPRLGLVFGLYPVVQRLIGNAQPCGHLAHGPVASAHQLTGFRVGTPRDKSMDDPLRAPSSGVSPRMRCPRERVNSTILRGAFSRGSGSDPKQNAVAECAKNLHNLRNDVAHHKILLNRDPDLQVCVRDLEWMTGLISPEIQEWMLDRSKVTDLLTGRPS